MARRPECRRDVATTTPTTVAESLSSVPVQRGWTETLFYSFQDSTESWAPNPGLILDQVGNLYGTTSGGGGSACEYRYADGCGTVFELSPNGSGGWTETPLYSFQGVSDSGVPLSGLIFDDAGNLYGTAVTGGGVTGCLGFGGCGTVFELSPNGSGEWTEAVLCSFRGGSDGAMPQAGLNLDRNGNLYGTTSEGGDTACFNGSGCGTIFELSPNSGGAWTETLLYRFQGGNDGWFPQAGLS
jgi:uncharacterized repeat protein (TIGR03803 family)